MSSSSLMRWSGFSALVGGVLLAVFNILEFILFSGQPESEAVGSNAWIVLEVGFILAAVMVILGLVGLYAHQARQAGSLGLIAFLVALTGSVMVSGVEWSAAFLGPWLIELAPEALDSQPPVVFLTGILLSQGLFALGWLLFGLASLQAQVLPRAASVLLIIGAIVSPALSMLELPFEVTLLGLAVAWMGYALWSERKEPARIMEAAA